MVTQGMAGGLLGCVVLIVCVASVGGDEARTVWLDELDVTLSSCGWQQTRARQSVGGNPLRMRGRTYERGIGTHPPGMLQLRLDGGGARFEAVVGIDDEIGQAGTAEFRVEGDGKLLWSSGVVRGGGEVKACKVELTGVKQLALIVDTTPDGYGCDHTDWADARLTMLGEARPAVLKSVRPYTHRWPPAEQVYHPAALPDPADRDEADAVLRRTGVLLERLRELPGCRDLTDCMDALTALRREAERIAPSDSVARRSLLERARRLRRRVAFANPLLNFDRIVFLKRHFCPNAEMTGNHMCDQYFGFNAIRGGGLFVLERPFSEQPEARDLLAGSVCANGRFKGRSIGADGGFLSLDVSYDARELLFAWTEIADRENDRLRYREWTEHNTYKVFRVAADGTGLRQLTDGPWNDFDPCFLPDGRIAFISERRGGYGRCHGRPVPSYTLHRMNGDGSGIVCLSPHETNEWQPSVDNDGMIVYTRWDYVDRGFNQAHHPWVTTPDGCDPRAIHGNFAQEHGGRPQLETTVRAVPGSRKLMATAACHHGQSYGSIILVDPAAPDDNGMGPVKRLTPDQLFPESEIGTHGDPANYGSPWPLSEEFFLCVYDPDSRSDAGTRNNYGIYLVDAFGNHELLYRDPQISCLDPIPLRPRPCPPIIPPRTTVAGDGGASGVAEGTVGVANVYDGTLPLPDGVRITRLRIVQLLPKTTPYANNPRIGYGDQKGARMVLGTVPVEEDGSALFRIPAGRPVYFQALDADGLAVQSMRSATYVQPGEKLFCRGCHEQRPSVSPLGLPRAWGHPPAEPAPEPEGTRPFSFARLVQPVLDASCVACHESSRRDGKSAPDLRRGEDRDSVPGWFTSYNSLRNYAFFWDNAVFDRQPVTTPGRFGARASRLYGLLAAGHHGVDLSPAALHRLTLWLDLNSDFYGSYENLLEQQRGESVWPGLE